MPPDSSKLGILAGGGNLPLSLLNHCRRQGREVMVLAFEGQADPALVEGVPHIWTGFGTVVSALEEMRRSGVRDVVMAGSLRRPSLATLKTDKPTARVLTRILKAALGDDRLLKSLIGELEKMGFNVMGADSIIGGLLAREGTYGRLKPDAQARADIARGIEVARELGRLDVGQAVVVQQGIVLGVEAAEGTDALMARSAPLRREGPGGVLVKISKPGQDRRADLPSIGPETVKKASQAGLRGIAVEAGATILIDAENIAAQADAAAVFLVGVSASGK